jgi:hypothetical protein
MLSQTLLLMSKSSNQSKIALIKEWRGSELPKNIWKNTKVYIYNYGK